MNIVDIAILVLLGSSAILGFRSGLIQSIFSLVGLVSGIAMACWNYQRFARELAPTVHSMALAEAICFSLLAIAIMVAAGLLGWLVKTLVHTVGLGWLDRLVGLLFGVVRGGLLATLFIVVLAAFFPNTRWLGEAQLARYFLGTAHLTVRLSPEQLKTRILEGLLILERETPNWLHEK